MAASLEHRRLAIAAALRAAMAEPAPIDMIEPVVETVSFDPTPATRQPQRRSLRDALTAEIDWDEPEHVDVLELDRSPDDLSGLEELGEDWVTPSVPPLEAPGSMSRVASLALFGHA
jgi:hypothetical protein